LRHALRTIANAQNGSNERRFHRAVVPPFAIPDHINFNGGAVFFPGTMSAGDDQGGEPFGLRPPICDHYFLIEIAYQLWRRTGKLPVDPEHLHRAFDVPEVDERIGAVVTRAPTRAVGFGFYDI